MPLIVRPLPLSFKCFLDFVGVVMLHYYLDNNVTLQHQFVGEKRMDKPEAAFHPEGQSISVERVQVGARMEKR
ncbi:MAG TPA: hypothetical protein VF099_06415, partial [Ktedonobacterales bacterium]